MHITGFVPGSDERRHWSINLYRVHSGTGRPIGIAWLGTDITARRAAAREAAAARRNLALLNEAGARIGNSLDLETTARELLDVVVPGFCDLATVDLYQGLLAGDETPPGLADGSAELRRVAFASAVSDAPFVGGRRRRRVGAVHHYPFNSPCADALRTARPQQRPRRGRRPHPVHARRADGRPRHRRRTRAVLPHEGQRAVRGPGPGPRGGAGRAGRRLYRQRPPVPARARARADPAALPAAAGRPGGLRPRHRLPLPARQRGHSEVGGDWFDVIELPGHRTALVVGDVMGRGLRAAVAMGELRTAVRTLALLDLEPAEVLSALDEIARGLGTPGGVQQATRAARRPRDADLSEVYLATCVYAVYDSVTRRCTFANAGHLPPVLVEPGEAALMLDVPPGMPLGVGGEPFEEVEVELPEGALLALYTDGLVESRDHPLDEGLQAFVGALTDPSTPLEDVCDHVLNTLDTHHGEDDIALLMARVQGLPADSVGDWTLPREPRSVGRAREYARAQLHRLGPGAPRRHDGAAGQRTGHQRPALRRGRDQAPAAPRPHPGLRGVGRRPRPAAPPPRPRHRRGRARACSWSACSAPPGAPAGRRAARRCGSNCRCRTGRTGSTDPAEALLSLF